MRRLILSFALVLVCGVALAQDADGELPAGAAAQPIDELAYTATLTLRGKPVACTYEPTDGTWSPPDVLEDPTAQNILNTAAIALLNANDIAAEYNLLLTQFNNHVLDADANFVTIDTNHKSLKRVVDQILSDIDKTIDVYVCPMCEEGVEAFGITLGHDGSYTEGVVYQENCVKAALSAGNSFVTQGRYAANNRQRIITLEEWKDITDPKVTDHEERIAELENADNDFVKKVWAIEEHDKLAKDTADVKFSLQAHIKNCNGDGDGTNIIEFATCDLCSNTNGVEVTELSFVAYKQAVGDKPAVPAHIESKKGTAIGCNDALNQVGDNVSELESAVGTVLHLPQVVETLTDWVMLDSTAQWEAIVANELTEKPYQGSISSLAEALDPNNSKTVGGKAMFLYDGSTTNYFTIPVGKLSYPPCEGVSSNDVEEIVKNYIDSEGGGCTCTPDEYLKEETDPIWEAEKSNYATLQDLEAFKDTINSLIEQMQLEVERISGDLANLRTEYASSQFDIANLQNEVAVLQTATNNINLRIDELDTRIDNLEGGN